MNDFILHRVKGVVLLNYLKSKFGWYFNQQQKSPTPSPMEAAENMMCRTRDSDVAWAPATLSFTLRVVLGLATFAHLGTPSWGRSCLSGRE